MLITLPGLIDIHVHLRDPGQTQKEDFFTGTSAALAGGFTTVLDMPNNTVPITTAQRLQEKIDIASKKTVCDIGFYFGSLGENIEEFKGVVDSAFGIKLYLNPTTGNYLIDPVILDTVYKNWSSSQPILVHAEADVISQVISTVRTYKKATHICHVSSESELTAIIKGKEEGLPITCGVCPHHLFLTQDDVSRLGAYGMMKPSLKSKNDKDFLWSNLNFVDVIESDHAPHTKEEKNPSTGSGLSIPFGVPGLETTLPLLLTAVSEGKLTIDRIIELCHTNPAHIFNISIDAAGPQGGLMSTRVEVDIDEKWVITNEKLKTKCKWSPFDGMTVKGKVKRVYLRGKKVFEDNKVLAEPGSGKVIKPINN